MKTLEEMLDEARLECVVLMNKERQSRVKSEADAIKRRNAEELAEFWLKCLIATFSLVVFLTIKGLL